MLPDTLHQLPQAERFAYAKLLAFVTRIDEELSIDEMAIFEQRLGTALLSPSQRKEVRGFLKDPPTLSECLAGLGPISGRLALRDATLMTAADGHVDPEERQVLDSIAMHVGLSNDVVDALLGWVLRGYDWMQEGIDLLNTCGVARCYLMRSIFSMSGHVRHTSVCSSMLLPRMVMSYAKRVQPSKRRWGEQ